MEFEQVLLSRKSCRSYTDTPVEEDKLERVVNAASLAPLGLPGQGKPHLTVVTDREMLRRLGGLFGPERDIIYGAPALIISSCPKVSMEGIDCMNAACTTLTMSLEATSLGLGSIFLCGVTAAIDKDRRLKKELGIPEGYSPLAALAVGYGTEEVKQCKTFRPSLVADRY